MRAPTVTLSGIAQDCHPGMPIRLVGVSGVSIAAFQISRVSSLMANLKTSDTTTTTDESAMIRVDTLSKRAHRLVDSLPALARVVSDSGGAFKLTIPATDSVVVYGTADAEDQPFYDAYQTMSGRRDASFVLDMARGGCMSMPTR